MTQSLHVCVCICVFLHVEPLSHVKFPSLLCRGSRRMSENGRCSIVNNDLQFVNSGTYFIKCQAYFSTIVSGLFSHRAPHEDKVTSLWWKVSMRETRKGYFLSPFFSAKSKPCWDGPGSHFQMFGNRKRRVLNQGWSSL